MRAAGVVRSALLESLHSHSVEGALEETRGNCYGSFSVLTHMNKSQAGFHGREPLCSLKSKWCQAQVNMF